MQQPRSLCAPQAPPPPAGPAPSGAAPPPWPQPADSGLSVTSRPAPYQLTVSVSHLVSRDPFPESFLWRAFQGEPPLSPTPAGMRMAAGADGASAPPALSSVEPLGASPLTIATVSRMADMFDEMAQLMRSYSTAQCGSSTAAAMSSRLEGGESQKRQDRRVHPASWAGPASVPVGEQVPPRDKREAEVARPPAPAFGRPGRPELFEQAPSGPAFDQYMGETRPLLHLAYLNQPTSRSA